jgi:hypothetical protein
MPVLTFDHAIFVDLIWKLGSNCAGRCDSEYDYESYAHGEKASDLFRGISSHLTGYVDVRTLDPYLIARHEAI